MDKIYYATSNTGKIASAMQKLEGTNIELLPTNLNIEEPYINDIKKIAKHKVLSAYDILKEPVIALDAGFYIENYPNNPMFPGAFPKRDLLDKIGIDKLLEIMSNVDNRECFFKECLAYYDGVNLKFFTEKIKGVLSYEKRGIDTKDKGSALWYVFIPDGYDITLAEMTDEERKNRSDNLNSTVKSFAKWYKKLKK